MTMYFKKGKSVTRPHTRQACSSLVFSSKSYNHRSNLEGNPQTAPCPNQNTKNVVKPDEEEKTRIRHPTSKGRCLQVPRQPSLDNVIPPPQLKLTGLRINVCPKQSQSDFLPGIWNWDLGTANLCTWLKLCSSHIPSSIGAAEKARERITEPACRRKGEIRVRERE